MRFVDHRGREVLHSRVDCWTDDRAREIARNLRSLHSIEIYEDDRHVARVEGQHRRGTTLRSLLDRLRKQVIVSELRWLRQARRSTSS